MADTTGTPEQTPEEFDQAYNQAVETKLPEHLAPTPSQTMPTEAPQSGEPVNVINPEGQLVSIAPHDVQSALTSGYQVATPDQVDHFENEQKYGSTGEQLKTALEGAAEGATFGLSTAAERALGVRAEDIRGRREVNPGSHMLGNLAGLVGSSFLPGVGEANVLEHAGESAAKALIPAAESTVAKIGSAAVKGAVENVIVQGGDELSKAFSQDPNQTVGTAIADIGLAGLIGGGIGGAIGSANPLWQATVGKKVGGVLKAVSDRLGGREGVVPSDVTEALHTTGIEAPPEIQAAMTNDPQIKQLASTLSQTDTNASGLKFQQSAKTFRTDAANAATSALGRSVEDLPAIANYSERETGKGIGETLAHEYAEKLNPLSKEFEDLKGRYSDAPLIKDGVVDNQGLIDASNPYKQTIVPNERIPGTATQLSEKLGQLAQQEGWIGADNEMSKEFNRVMSRIPKLEQLKNITELATQVGNNTRSTLPFGMQTPLSRAGQLIKGVLQDAEETLARQHLGEAAPELIGRYDAARAGYRDLAKLKDAINDRLKVGGSVSGFAKGLKEMANTDAEAIARRLSGKGDAQLLEFLSKNFPATAEKVKQMHLDQMLRDAVKKAKDEPISIKALRTNLANMSPEIRNFALSAESQAKIDAVGKLTEAFNDSTHNFSNTARTVDKLLGSVPGSAIGLVTTILAHNPALGVVVGMLTRTLGKDVPDAARLGLLKFLGSSQPIEAEGFKHMVEFISHVKSGNDLIGKSVKNIYKAGKEVLPQAMLPTEKDRSKLDKQLKSLQSDPSPLLNAGGKTNYYLPDHGAAIGQTASSAVNYLNSIRPETPRKSPLDRPLPPNPIKQASFEKALDIAQQPLSVLHSMQKGTITSQDVVHLKTLYPSLYSSLAQKLSGEMTDVIAKGKDIPYSTKIGLSVFLGQAMDSTLSPQSIIAAQPKAAQAQPQTASQPASNPKRSTTALNKLPAQYMTASQARQAEKAQRD